MASEYTVLTATIPVGQSLSGVIDLNGYKYVAIQIPTPWTSASLTFQAAIDSTEAYYNVYDASGNEVTITATSGKVFSDITKIYPFRYIKIRSGTGASPVNQTGTRTLKLIVKE